MSETLFTNSTEKPAETPKPTRKPTPNIVALPSHIDAAAALAVFDERIVPESEADDFCWTRDRADVIFEKQPRTAVHWNPLRQLVIRQENDFDTDDHWIFFEPDRLPALIARLQTEYDSWLADRKGGQ